MMAPDIRALVGEKPLPIYEADHTLLSGSVDMNKQLRLRELFRLFQDIAGLHSSNLGGGVDMLSDEHGAAWVLIRVRVEIDRLPTLFESVHLETWPQAPAKMYDRDYILRGEDGEVAIRASSLWVIMNVETREMITKQLLDYSGVQINKERALGGAPRRLRAKHGEPAAVFKKTLRYSDIDYNGHANNTKYVEYAADVFSIDEVKEKELKSFEINFEHEAACGETLEIRRADVDGEPKKVFVDGVSNTDGRLIFQSMFEFK